MDPFVYGSNHLTIIFTRNFKPMILETFSFWQNDTRNIKPLINTKDEHQKLIKLFPVKNFRYDLLSKNRSK